jgi:predicted RNA-binding Zn-ribbon protein involved in translation (DUF1610 family)
MLPERRTSGLDHGTCTASDGTAFAHTLLSDDPSATKEDTMDSTKITCPECGQENNPDQEMCTKCGASLSPKEDDIDPGGDEPV